MTWPTHIVSVGAMIEDGKEMYYWLNQTTEKSGNFRWTSRTRGKFGTGSNKRG